MTNKLWGIDLGGTKVEGIVLDEDNRSKVLCRMRIPTEGDKGYNHILSRIKELTFLMSNEVGDAPGIIGIGTPGSLDPQTKLLKNSNSTCLNGQPFKKDMEELLGIPIKIANDANCFALAETQLGAAHEYNHRAKVVFGVIMGTGVGGGIIVNGQVIDGHQGIAGEWGHNFLHESGGTCYCGKVGCVETVISGPALENYYYELSGKQKPLREIVEIAHKDASAKATVDRLVKYYGLGISGVINLLDPDIIVLGGGLANIDALYDQGRAEIEKHVFNTELKTTILKPKLGDSAGVFGAALLVAD